jgi:hypothetical protein
VWPLSRTRTLSASMSHSAICVTRTDGSPATSARTDTRLRADCANGGTPVSCAGARRGQPPLGGRGIGQMRPRRLSLAAEFGLVPLSLGGVSADFYAFKFASSRNSMKALSAGSRQEGIDEPADSLRPRPFPSRSVGEVVHC